MARKTSNRMKVTSKQPSARAAGATRFKAARKVRATKSSVSSSRAGQAAGRGVRKTKRTGMIAKEAGRTAKNRTGSSRPAVGAAMALERTAQTKGVRKVRSTGRAAGSAAARAGRKAKFTGRVAGATIKARPKTSAGIAAGAVAAGGAAYAYKRRKAGKKIVGRGKRK